MGPNASGKTSVLEAMHLAVSAATGEPEKVFRYERHCDWLYSRGGSGDLSVAVLQHRWGTLFGCGHSSALIFRREQTICLGKGRWEFKVVRATGVASGRRTAATRPSMVFLHLNARQLAKARIPIVLRREWNTRQGLASVLAYMALNDPDGFDKLVDMMRN